MLLRAHVDQLMVDASGRCEGVRLADGSERRARVGVISNAPVWATAKVSTPLMASDGL